MLRVFCSRSAAAPVAVVRTTTQLRYRRRSAKPDLDHWFKDRGLVRSRPDEGLVNELVKDEGKYQRMREELDRKMKRLQEQGPSPDRTLYSPPPPDVTKKSIDREMNLINSGAELNEKDGYYYVGSTKVPEHLEHWLTEPMGIKNPRDLKISKKLQKMKIDQSKKTLKGNRKDPPGAITRRMVRIQSMLMREVNILLGELPAHVALGEAGHFAPSESYSSAISSSLVHVKRVEVTRDLMQARFFWDCLPGKRNVVERELRRITPQFRFLLQQRIQMKYAPDIKFVVDVPTLQEIDSERRLDEVERELAEQGMLFSDDREEDADENSTKDLQRKGFVVAPTLAPGLPNAARPDKDVEGLDEFEEEAETQSEPKTAAEAEAEAAAAAAAAEKVQKEQLESFKKKENSKFFAPKRPFDFRDRSMPEPIRYAPFASRKRKYL